MAYEKTNWVNDETPLNAENMNKIEQGIENLQILQGTSAPDSSIVAEIGQFYLDTVAKKLYQYVAIDEWQPVGRGGVKKYLHTVNIRDALNWSLDNTFWCISEDGNPVTTKDEIATLLYRSGYTSRTKYAICNGAPELVSQYGNAYGIYCSGGTKETCMIMYNKLSYTKTIMIDNQNYVFRIRPSSSNNQDYTEGERNLSTPYNQITDNVIEL